MYLAQEAPPVKSKLCCIAASASLFFVLGCAGGDPAAPPPAPMPTPPAGWADDVALPEARDVNPDPAIVEVTIAARVASVSLRPGTMTEAWTYNGGVPGPL